MRLLLLCTLILSFTQSFAAIRWLETDYNFGSFDEDMGKVSCNIRMLNEGPEEVVIQDVRPTCGCTAAGFPKHAIAPGDTVAIKITYNPYGRPGVFEKDVIVITNSTPKRTVLKVRGNVIGAANTIRSKYPESAGNIKFNRLIIPFGEISKTTTKSASIKVYNQGYDSVSLTFPNLPTFLNAYPVPEKIGEGGICTVTLFYDGSKQPDWGTVTNHFTIQPINASGDILPAAQAEVIAIVADDKAQLEKKFGKNAPQILFSPTSLDCNVIDASSTTPITLTLNMKNIGTETLEVHKIYSANEAIEVSPTSFSLKKGAEKNIKVIVDPQKCTGDLLNAKLMVVSNDPTRTIGSVRIIGEVKR